MNPTLVYLSSDALGDTICFMPCVDHYLSTVTDEVVVRINPRYEKLFRKSYPAVSFYKDGAPYAKKISIEYSFDRPMQEGMANQLGIPDWKYIRPKIDGVNKLRPLKKKYVAVGIHSTAQLKYWNSEKGREAQKKSPYWNDLFRKLMESDYIPVVLEKYEMFGVAPYRNGIPASCVRKVGLSLAETLGYIQHAEFFIGLSSGLSWAAHALGKPVVMIANFSEEWHEFDLAVEDYIRVTNKSVCHGCWNEVGHKYEFDYDDWYWCPRHQNTGREFECHTSMTPTFVFDKFRDWLK